MHAIGGVASVLGGGKFENGAVTGAFGYLFNDAMHDWARAGAAMGGSTGAVAGGLAVGAGEGTCIALTEGACAAAVANPVGAAAITGGAVQGGIIGGGAGNKIGGFLGSVYDWLSGTSDVPSMGVLESRGPTLHCQNVECGAPTGGVTYPVCQTCNDRLRNGGPPITLENGHKLREPVVPGGETDEEKK